MIVITTWIAAVLMSLVPARESAASVWPITARTTNFLAVTSRARKNEPTTAPSPTSFDVGRRMTDYQMFWFGRSQIIYDN